MTQTIAKKKYIQYLTYKTKTQQEIDQDAIEELKKDLQRGHCFGFSVSDAVYGVFEYDVWWQHRQVETTNWNGKSTSLHKKINLQCYLPPTHVPVASDGEETLQDLFERNINYIVSLQLSYARRTPEFHEVKLSQYNLLKPKNKFTVFINNEPRYIQDWDRICRHFSWRELALFLENNKQEITGNACLVYCHDHIVSIKYKKNRWVIYDPNYNHRSQKKMTKKFRSNWRAALEIFWILQAQSIGFDVATFDEGRSVSFKPNAEMTPAEALKMMRGTGFHMIAEHTKNCLAQIIKMAEQDEEVKKAVIKGLLRRDSHDSTGLDYVIDRAPAVFARLLKLARQDEDYAEVIRDFFRKDQNFALKMIAKKAPNAMPRLLRLAANDDLLPAKIAGSLLQVNKNGCLFIKIILRKKRLLTHFLQLADKRVELELAIVMALRITNQDGASGFKILLRETPHALSQLIKHAYSSPLMLNLLAEFLGLHVKNKRTGLHQLLFYAPELLPALLKLGSCSGVIRHALAAALVEKSLGKNSGFLYLAKYAGDSLPQLFNLAARDNTVGKAIAAALIQHNGKNRAGLESLMKKKPDALPYLLNLAGDSREMYAAFLSILRSASKKQHTQLLAVLVENGIPEKQRTKRAFLLKRYRKKNDNHIPELLEELITANRKTIQSNKKTSLKNHSIFRPATIHSGTPREHSTLVFDRRIS